MKKIVFLLFIIISIVSVILHKKEILIPSEAIRIRIIANSDDISDQKNKTDVKNEVSSYIYSKLKYIDNYEEANNMISNNLIDIEKIVSKYSSNFKLYFGMNEFPEKEYKGVTYKEGNYNSLVIKLGKGMGANFWCVLFPPLCLIDEEKLDDVSYELYVKKLLKLVK